MSMLTLFSSFFKQNEISTPLLKDENLHSKIQALSFYSDLDIFINTTIHNRTYTYDLPLLIFDAQRGLYIFELREWSLDELKNVTITATKQHKAKANNLSFSTIHQQIREKLAPLDSLEIPLYNYLILDSLTTQEYKKLPHDIQESLPQDTLIFKDSQTSEIFQKLQKRAIKVNVLPKREELLPTLFPQYTIIKEDGEKLFATVEQRSFLDAKLAPLYKLQGEIKSGKSSLLLLKALHLQQKYENKSITIIKASRTGKEEAEKLLELHSIPNNIKSKRISIVEAEEFLSQEYRKAKVLLNTADISQALYVDRALLKQKAKTDEIILCDDTHLLEDHFLAYLVQRQKKSNLFFVNYEKELKVMTLLQHSFIKPKYIRFKESHPLIEAMHLISQLLQEEESTILLVSNKIHQQKLFEDLESFLSHKIELFRHSYLMTQQSRLYFANYSEIADISVSHTILLDICEFKTHTVEYALSRATESVTLIYEQECGLIKILKEKYES